MSQENHDIFLRQLTISPPQRCSGLLRHSSPFQQESLSGALVNGNAMRSLLPPVPAVLRPRGSGWLTTSVQNSTSEPSRLVEAFHKPVKTEFPAT